MIALVEAAQARRGRHTHDGTDDARPRPFKPPWPPPHWSSPCAGNSGPGWSKHISRGCCSTAHSPGRSRSRCGCRSWTSATWRTRGHLCLEELRLNRRLAPSIYLDVVAIRGTPGAPRLDGEGPAIEYALRMRQFAPGALLSERLAAGTLQAGQLDRLAQRLAAFHAAAEAAAPGTPYGTPGAIEGDARRLVEGLAQHGLAASHCARLQDWLQAQAAAPARPVAEPARRRPRARGPWRPAPGQCRGAGRRRHRLRLPRVRPGAALDRRASATSPSW